LAPVLSGALTSATTATLSWTAASGITNNFRLDVATNPEFDPLLAGYNGQIQNLTYPLSGLLNNTPYYTRVRAVNASGASVNSNTVTLLTVPAPPVMNTVTSSSSSSISASWSAPAGASEYLVYVATDQSFTNTITGYNGVEHNLNTIQVSGLSAGTLYYVRVRAKNILDGESDPSNTASIRTRPVAPAPLAPTHIAAQSFKARWNSVNSATQYVLYVSADPTFQNGVTPHNVSALDKDISGLTPGVTYYYRVAAENESGLSTPSSSVTVTPLTSWLQSPNGGQTFIPGSTINVALNTGIYTPSGSVSIELYKGASKVFPSSGTHTSMTIPTYGLPAGSDYRVRIIDLATSNEDLSNTSFTIFNDYNYVRSTAVSKSGVKDSMSIATLALMEKSVSTTFVDGLGRPIQQIAHKSSPTEKDVVQLFEYDSLGREVRKYLPFTAGDNGWVKTGMIDPITRNYAGAAADFYNTQSGTIANAGGYPYAKTIYETSPLNRVVKQGAPGEVWQPDGNHSTQRTKYCDSKLRCLQHQALRHSCKLTECMKRRHYLRM
jgi:hypothetical protein